MNTNNNNNSNETSNNITRTQQPVPISNPPNRPNLASLISAHIQATTSNMSLSASLPGSIASSLNTNSANVNSMQQSLVGSECKMDTSGPISTTSTAVFVGDIISKLYPNVNQQDTPLPRQWSVVHKQNTLKLTQSNLRVTYTGPGKTHKDAAAIRTDHVIPPACGIYYYEIKIISKGRDGYMGIGLSKADVQLCRLPGWDKNSYGYHGDDGHSFCCSGTGQNYGPTFTTGDVIGCCLNLIDNTCFYTKNGYNLGIAFRDLPSDLYPTIGLQTPSESVEANFGQYPFEFDILNFVKEWHAKTRQTIQSFPLKKEVENNLPIISRKLISTYLVHQGYSNTAEVFSKSVGHVFEEELASIRNRQKIQGLVLEGKLSEAIENTYQLFPGILEKNANLLFCLKIREFIEMVSSVNKIRQNTNSSNTTATVKYVKTDESNNGMVVDIHETQNGIATTPKTNGNASKVSANEEDMEMDSSDLARPVVNNCDVVEPTQIPLIFPDVDYTNLQRLLQFGRDLFQMNASIENGENQSNKKMLRDAFSLLAYHDPWNSPLGYQLDPSQRENVSSLLNSVILEANNMPRISPLEVIYGQTNECMRLMSKYGVPWCAYVNLNDYMQS